MRLALGIEQDVGRFQVAVQDAALMLAGFRSLIRCSRGEELSGALMLSLQRLKRVLPLREAGQQGATGATGHFFGCTGLSRIRARASRSRMISSALRPSD
jgi:hypothetical protein